MSALAKYQETFNAWNIDQRNSLIKIKQIYIIYTLIKFYNYKLYYAAMEHTILEIKVPLNKKSW